MNSIFFFDDIAATLIYLLYETLHIINYFHHLIEFNINVFLIVSIEEID